MVRDFTQATKERLSNEIDDINKSTWSPVTDAIGDVLMYGGKWIGLISLNDDMSNVESYHRRVLDMTDTTKKELQQIFDDVYAVDREYKRHFEDLNERESVYNEKLKCLYERIKPNFTICDAQTIKALISDFDAKLKAIDSNINSNFEKELDWAAKQAAWESAKGAFSGILKGIVDIFTLPVSMVKNITTGNHLGIFTDTWAIIDDVFAVGSNLVGLASLGLGYTVSFITGNNEQKHMAIQYGEAYGGASGLTEALEADEKVNGGGGLVSGMKWVSQKIDTASAAVGLWSDAKGFLDDPSSMIDPKLGFNFEVVDGNIVQGKLKTLKKADMLAEYQEDYRKWQALYRRFGKEYHYVELKNLSKLYKYAEPFWNISEGIDTVLESEKKTFIESSNKWFKAIEDSYDFGEELYEAGGDIINLSKKVYNFVF